MIVDQATVVTGSMNLSNNGAKNNDENVVIIHNSDIARQFVNEFTHLWDQITWPNEADNIQPDEADFAQ